MLAVVLGQGTAPPLTLMRGGALGVQMSPSPAWHSHGLSRKEVSQKSGEKIGRYTDELLIDYGRQNHCSILNASHVCTSVPKTPVIPNSTYALPSVVNWVSRGLNRAL